MVERGDETGAAEGWPAPDGLLRGPDRPGLLARLERWIADARVDDAALQRSRARWLQEVADQEATLAGTLLDLAERQAVVALRTTSGRTHHGVIDALGVDFACLRPSSGAVVLVATRQVVAVRTSGPEGPVSGDRAVRSDLRLADVLRELAADRERVRLVVGDGGDAIAGQLRSAGEDVLTVRTDGEPGSTAYAALTAVVEVTLG